MKSSAAKNITITLLKILAPIAIIVWLLFNIEQDKLLELQQRPKNWPLLGASFLLILFCVSLTFIRWRMLVRALDMPFSMRDAFRLGFLAYLLNFVSFGSVGGDIFKAVFIAREHPGRRAEAVATVVVDRMIGLYALLVVTSAALLLADIPQPTPALIVLRNMAWLATAIGALVIMMILTPGFTSGSLSEFLAGLPKVGPMLGRLISAMRMYRRKKGVLTAIGGMSLMIHLLIATAIYLMARALFQPTPTWGEHLIIVPLSMVAGAMPFTPAGLGAFEFAMDELYRIVPQDGSGAVSGVLVALTFRVVTIGIATIGIFYYWTCRAEVRDVLAEAEQDEEK